MVIRISGSGSRPENQQETASGNPGARLFEDFLNNWAMRTALANRSETWRPAVDIFEKDSKLFIRMEIPGMDEKDIDLKLDGGTLIIKGERRPHPEDSGYQYHRVESYYGAFSRSFDLPDSVDPEKITAAYRNGVLAITILQKPEVQPRSIKVNIGK